MPPSSGVDGGPAMMPSRFEIFGITCRRPTPLQEDWKLTSAIILCVSLVSSELRDGLESKVRLFV